MIAADLTHGKPAWRQNDPSASPGADYAAPRNEIAPHFTIRQPDIVYSK
jgi:hypothetical protein